MKWAEVERTNETGIDIDFDWIEINAIIRVPAWLYQHVS